MPDTAKTGEINTEMFSLLNRLYVHKNSSLSNRYIHRVVKECDTKIGIDRNYKTVYFSVQKKSKNIL